MIKCIYRVIFVSILIFCLCPMIYTRAQEQKERKTVKSGTKELTGIITGISANSISLMYNHDVQKGTEYEIMLPIDTSTKLEHRRSLKELKTGDMVAVMFEERVMAVPEEGQRTERKTKQISFVRAAEKKPKSLKPPEPGEGLPDDI